MNKRELIEKYKAQLKNKNPFGELVSHELIVSYFLDDLKQLDEPQKVKIPQFVADVIEDLREDSSELEQAFQSAWWYESDEFTEWYKKKSNRNVFWLAWLGGYEVKKEPKYIVKLKGVYHGDLGYAINFEGYSFYCKERSLSGIRFTHTRKELEEAGFGWVFDCEGVEVVEVTE